MDPAPVALTGLPFQFADEWRVERRHLPEDLLDAFAIGENQQPLAPRQQLAGGLGAAQQQHSEQRGPLLVQFQLLLEALVVLHHPDTRSA